MRNATLELPLKLLFSGGVEGGDVDAAAAGAFELQAALVVVHQDGETVAHGTGLAEHEFVKVGPYHEVNSRLDSLSLERQREKR